MLSYLEVAMVQRRRMTCSHQITRVYSVPNGLGKRTSKTFLSSQYLHLPLLVLMYLVRSKLKWNFKQVFSQEDLLRPNATLMM